MAFKAYVENAFGADAEERIFHFLLEKQLAGCGDDTLRWMGLFEACEQWRKQFLLWKDSTYINGINGWNLCMRVYKLRLPKGDDWTIYLYHMTLLAVVDGMSIGKRTSMAEAGQKYNNFSAIAVMGKLSEVSRDESCISQGNGGKLSQIQFCVRRSQARYERL